MRRGLGWKVDPPKDLDRPLSLSPHSRIDPRSSVSMRSLVLDVLDQENLGSCVAQSIQQAFRILAPRRGEQQKLGSRLFVYYLARATHGDTLADTGTHIRAGLDVCRKLGWPDEEFWPYDPTGDSFAMMPSANAFRHASDRRRDFAYYRVRTERDLKCALTLGFPVVFGTDVTEGFVEGTMKFNEPIAFGEGGVHVGGHAMTAIGYQGDAIEVVNSWGKSWGNKGFFHATLDFVLRSKDLWAITLG